MSGIRSSSSNSSSKAHLGAPGNQCLSDTKAIAAVITKVAHGHTLPKNRFFSSRSQNSRSITRCGYKDQERMTQIQTLVDKLQAGYQTKSFINELVKRAFSGASRRTIKELGNIELYELGELSKTVQCQTCLRCSKGVQRTPHRTHACAHFSYCALYT